MGWAFGIDGHGRDVGYGVEAVCDQPGCEAKIDRGLAYVCGGDAYGGEHGCGYHFCSTHLEYTWRGDDEEEMSPQLCPRCAAAWTKNEEI